MKSIINYLIKAPVLVNLALLLVLIGGLMITANTRFTMLPSQPIKYIDIQTLWRGASPQEVEEAITIKIEDNLEGVIGIERVTSISKENLSVITVEIEEGKNANAILQDVNNAVDKISTFPKEADKSVVSKREIVNATINVALKGEQPLYILKDFAERIRKDFIAIDGLSQIYVEGYPDEEIQISLNEDKLKEYELTFIEVADAVRRANLKASGGDIKDAENTILIRADEKAYYAKDMQNIILKTTSDGASIRLKVVAKLSDQFEDKATRRFVDEQDAIIFRIFSLDAEDILKNAEAVKQYVNDYNETNHALKMVVIEDTTKNLEERIKTLSDNGIVGAILVLLVLALFLDKYLAFWVAFKIPVALLGMMMISVFYGLTINQVSMFGAILVLGILVDDGVVIAENIFQHFKEKGKPPIQAALEGTMEVLPPVFASLTTTAIAFSLFFFIDGTLGDFFSDVSFVVIGTLVVALIGSFFMLPAQIAHSRALDENNKPSKIERWTNDSVLWLRDKIYTPVLKFSLKGWGIPTIVISLLVVVVCVSTIPRGILKTTFFPNIEQDVVQSVLTMPPGTSEAVTMEKLDFIESKFHKVNERLSENRDKSDPFMLHVEKSIGPGTHQGIVRAYLVGGEYRDVLSFDVANMLRDSVGQQIEAQSIAFGNPAFIFGKPVSIGLVGSDLEELRAAKEMLITHLKEREDVKDITDTDDTGITEIKLSLSPLAENLGFSITDILSQVRGGFFGILTQSIQRGDEEVKVWVRYEDEARNSIELLRNMRIRTPLGGSYPLRELANLEQNEGILSINHQNTIREIKVEADIARLDLSVPILIGDIQANIEQEIRAKHPEVAFTYEGQNRESSKAISSIQKYGPFILLLMFALIVINFKSFSQATIVFLLFPFTIIGVIIGHLIHGVALSIFSVIGLIALIGVVVNNSLVFIDAFNDLLIEGKTFGEALIESAKSRFRAILLTTITTVAGLAPLIGSKSLGAQFLKPPAISIAYGLGFSLLITLFILPSLLLLFNFAKRGIHRFWEGEKISAEEIEPAVQAQKMQTN